MKLKKYLKRFSLWVGLPIVLFIGMMWIITGVYGNRVGQMVIKHLNKGLKTELRVGKVDMSIIPTFPNASVNLYDVTVMDATGKKPFIKAERISFRMKLLSLLSGNYKITSVALVNADIDILTDANGRANYEVVNDKPETPAQPTTTEKKSESNLNLSIKRAIFSNVRLHYKDDQSRRDVKARIEDCELSGDLKGEKYALQSEARIFCDYVDNAGSRMIEGKMIKYNTRMNIDNLAGKYSFDKTTLNLGDNAFEVTGTITSQGDDTNFDVLLHGTKAHLGEMLSIGAASTTLGGFETNAELKMTTSVKGKLSKTTIPEVNLIMSLDKGKVTHPDMAGAIKDVSFTLNFSTGRSGRGDDSRLDLTGFKGMLNGNPIDIKLTTKGMDNPYIDLGFRGKISLGELYGLLGKSITGGTGAVDFQRLDLHGYLNDMTNPASIANVSIGASINFDNATLEQNGEKLGFQRGNISMESNTLSLSDLQINGAGCDFQLSGNFSNLIPVMLADASNSGGAMLDFDGNLFSNVVDLDRLKKFFLMDEETTKEEAIAQQTPLSPEDQKSRDAIHNEAGPVGPPRPKAKITDFLNGTFHSRIGQVKWGKIEAKNFNGDLEFGKQQMRLKNITADAFGGAIQVDAQMAFGFIQTLDMFLFTRSVDVNRFLSENDNFGQKELTDKNLKGRLDMALKLTTSWDPKGDLMQDQIKALADVSLKDGELNDYKVLKSASGFIKVKDLERVVFSEIKTQFEIKNGTFNMPTTFIQSNAANVMLAGQQKLNGDFKYWIRVNAGQVLMNKFKKFNKYKPLPAKKKGLFNINILAFGNANKGNYDWKFDNKAVRKAFARDKDREMQAVENNLRTEFNNLSIVTPPDDLSDDETAPVEEE